MKPSLLLLGKELNSCPLLLELLILFVSSPTEGSVISSPIVIKARKSQLLKPENLSIGLIEKNPDLAAQLNEVIRDKIDGGIEDKVLR